MKTKFTPGPWVAGRGGAINGGTSQVALATLDGKRSDEERDANQRLICAATQTVQRLYEIYSDCDCTSQGHICDSCEATERVLIAAGVEL